MAEIFRTRVEGPMADGPRAIEIWNQEIRRALEESTQELERRLVTKTPVGATSNLVGSVFGEVRGIPARTGIVGITALYAPVVELGRTPGKPRPPIGPIELWVRRKLGIPEGRSRQVAFAIAAKIAKRGTRAQRMVQRTADEGETFVPRIFERMRERVAARLNGQGFGI